MCSIIMMTKYDGAKEPVFIKVCWAEAAFRS
jgi:hypothetical protein